MAVPQEYDPDNLLGNFISVLSDRTGKDPEHIARLIAEHYGDSDFSLAEFRLWDRFARIADDIQNDLDLEWAT